MAQSCIQSCYPTLVQYCKGHIDRFLITNIYDVGSLDRNRITIYHLFSPTFRYTKTNDNDNCWVFCSSQMAVRGTVAGGKPLKNIKDVAELMAT